MRYKTKRIPHYNFTLIESVNFYFYFFIASIDGYKLIFKKFEKQIKELLYNQLSAYKFQRGNWYINHDMNFLSIQRCRSELGHLTKVWDVDWDWIIHHIESDYREIGKCKNLIETFGDKEIYVYKKLPDKYYKTAENIYLKNTNTREPKIFKLSKLFKNGYGLKPKIRKFKPVIGVTLWSGLSNEQWDLTEIKRFDINQYWDRDIKGFRYKKQDSKKYAHIPDIKFTIKNK